MGCIASVSASQNAPPPPTMFSWTNLTKNAAAQSAAVGPTPVEQSGCLKQFLTAEERSRVLASDQLHVTSKLLLNPPFIAFSAFNEQLFITGFGGLTADMLISRRIKALVNVSEEVFLDVSSTTDCLIYVRYPVSILVDSISCIRLNFEIPKDSRKL